MPKKQFKHVGLGGTFDRFHDGHKQLIATALKNASKVSVGVTVDNFPFDKKLDSIMETFQQRQKFLKHIYHDQIKSGRLTVFPLLDECGPTLTDPTIDGIVVTKQTMSGAKKINQARQQQGWPPLKIIVCPLVKDQTTKYISSTRIRMGQVNRQGVVYQQYLKNRITLSGQQKAKLKKPWGQIVHSQQLASQMKKHKPTVTAVVGDYSLSTFIEQKIPFNLGIYDGKTQREKNNIVEQTLKKHHLTIPIVKITNKAGEVSVMATKTIQKYQERPHQLIEVQGEEDVLVIPLILLLPLNSLVWYGQPSKGMVMVRVDEEIKQRLVKTITH